jgi:hypothetical protein
MIKILRRVQAGWRLYKSRRFLARHNCETWRQYRYHYDPDYNLRATRVQDKFHGYPYIYRFADHTHEVYDWNVHLDGIYRISQWCDRNLQDKYRFEALRVSQDYAGEWSENGIGHSDYIFAGFKTKKDYMLFVLKWS